MFSLNRKKDISGLIFSAILVIAYVICSYFFIGIIESSKALGDSTKLLLVSLVFVLFGLILFYATRVGDGKQIHRFSLATLIILDLPALYIILSAAAPGLPFPLDLTQSDEIVKLAAVALGYGIPYTFLSGYEQDIILENKSDHKSEESCEPDELDEPSDKDTETDDGEDAGKTPEAELPTSETDE